MALVTSILVSIQGKDGSISLYNLREVSLSSDSIMETMEHDVMGYEDR